MPRVDPGYNSPPPKPKRRRQPKPRPAPSFTRSPVERPFAPQQRQAARRTQRAVQRLPRPVVASPPVIRNPTPRQTQAAARQIAHSLTRAVGPGGSNRDRIARRDAIIAQVRTDPRLTRVKRSLEHWQREQARLINPDAFRDRVKAGPAPTKARIGVGPLNLATVNLTALSGAINRGFAAATPGLHSGTAEAQFARNALGDVRTLATAPFIGAYELGSLGADVVTGHPGRAAGKAARFGRGVAEQTTETVRHPGRSFVEHPILTGLTFSGIGSVGGRAAGAVARGAGSTVEAAGVRGALARAGSTARSPIALTDDLAGGIVERGFSKDLTRKAAQRARDASREPLRDAEGKVVTVRQRGREVPVLKPRSERERARLAKRRGDLLASRANLAERLERDVESKARKIKGVRSRAGRDVVAMVAEGTITSARHFKTDLSKHVTRLRGLIAQHDADIRATGHSTVFRHEGELEKAQARVRTGEKILGSPKALAQAERIVKAGTEHGRALVGHDTEASSAGLIDAEQARRARLVVAAVEHMGARHGRSPALNARIAQARKVERSLQARLNFGHHEPGERKSIQAQLETTRRLRADMQARNTERLRTAEGKPLEPEHIEEFLRSRGRDPETVAYLPANVSRRQFHRQFRPEQGRGTLDTAKGPRTGEAHRKGATEASADILRAAGVRVATAVTKAKQIDRLIGEHGLRHPAWAKAQRGQPLTKLEARVAAKGGYFTGREAAEAISRADARGERLVAIRAYPAKLSAEDQRLIRDDAQSPGAAEALGQRLLNSRFLTADELAKGGARNVVLMNADLVKRLGQHLTPSGSLKRFGQILNRAFRYAVLPQPRWLAGNFIEPLLVRMPGVGSGINVFGLAVDLRAASRVIRTMERHPDPAVRAAAQEIRAHQFGGLLIGGRGQTIHRGLEDFPALNADAEKAYGKVIARMPAVAHLGDLSGRLLRNGGKAILAPLETIFHLNRAGESVLQRAAFGKSARRDIQELTGSWTQTIRLGQQAADEAARGLVNTATQERFMRAQHELLGKYEGFNPTLRAVVQGVAPFIPWALNAARFVLWTMPAHRSAQTALLVQVNNIVSQDWQDIHRGVPPGMGLALPNGKGGWVDAARYTPYGLTGPIAEGELRGITSQFLPQVSGVENAIEGRDPFGRDLVLASGQDVTGADKAKIGANEILEALVPYLSNARRLQEHGETAYADSTVLSPKTKPGTSHGMSAARRVFDPFRPTYLSSGPSVESGPAPAAPRLTRREALLARRAQLLQSRGGPSTRTEELLRRRAELLSRSR